jgi:sugar phosphate isomerase/epimerase
VTRRSFLIALAAAAGAPRLWAEAAVPRRPIGLMLYGLRDELDRDFNGTLTAVRRMGYEGVEFFGPYFFWSEEYTRGVRKLLDDLGLVCFSTHNESYAFTPDGFTRAMELNRILGSRGIVAVRGLAPKTGREAYHGFEGSGLDGYHRLADRLGEACERLHGMNMTCAFHNHAVEFEPLEGIRPIDILAKVPELRFHLGVGSVGQFGNVPVAFMRQYPGRTQCLLCSDWPARPDGKQPLLGEGKEPWKETLAAADQIGGVDFYLIQQESSAIPPLEAVAKDLAAFRRLTDR